jgi:periplasmic mercuric ion binding protein
MVSAFTVEAKGNKDKIVHDTITVHGVCNQCKMRIENAALIKGVKRAEWNKENNQLAVVYDTTKTQINAIHQSVAKTGHQTGKVKADEGAYNNLPDCCKYQDGVHKH